MRRRLALALLLASSCGGAAEPVEPPSVLLIVVDTLRADRAASPDVAPELARFAAGAARFTHASTPRAKTTPAVASLLTGLYPHDHGVRDLASRLDQRVPTLAEAFARAGYDTLGIVGNFVLKDARSGLARGFATWDETLPDLVGVPPDGVPQRRATSLTDAALAAFEEGGALAGSRRFFCYLHYMDPHGAYDPPPSLVRAADEPDPVPAAGALPDHPIHPLRVAEYNAPASARLADGRIDAARVRALYDGEVRYVDREIGRLLAALEAAGRLEHAIVVITADHGESLGEHAYYFEHGFYAYEATCRVPLYVRAPAVAPRAIDAGASLVDVAPTLLELCGLPDLRAPDGAAPRGRSLAPLLRGEDPGEPRAVFSEKIEAADRAGTVQAKAVRIGDWKLIRRYAHREPGGPEREPVVLGSELYDLARDPDETANLFEAPPAGAPLARLSAELLGFASADVRFADLARELARDRARLEREDPAAARILEQLGY